MLKNYSIEYSHIYVSQTFGGEQLRSLELMKEKRRQLIEAGCRVSRHVLIDNYSTATGLNRFDIDNFLKALSENDATPDFVMLESEITAIAKQLVAKITDSTIRKSLTSYYKTRNKWPCSMCIASWYLMRLGKLKSQYPDIASEKIISILPDRFRTPEDEARNIIAATEFKDCINDIEIIFFSSKYDGYSDWSEFDATEYVTRNYLTRVLPEDKSILGFAADYLEKNCRTGSLRRVVDVGAGPNMYPTLLIKPYLAAAGSMELLDPVAANRDFLVKAIAEPSMWDAFEEVLHNKNPQLYSLTAKLPHNLIVRDGDIFKLEQSKYDLVISFFVAESITNKPAEVKAAMDCLKAAVRPGGGASDGAHPWLGWLFCRHANQLSRHANEQGRPGRILQWV